MSEAKEKEIPLPIHVLPLLEIGPMDKRALDDIEYDRLLAKGIYDKHREFTIEFFQSEILQNKNKDFYFMLCQFLDSQFKKDKSVLASFIAKYKEQRHFSILDEKQQERVQFFEELQRFNVPKATSAATTEYPRSINEFYQSSPNANSTEHLPQTWNYTKQILENASEKNSAQEKFSPSLLSSPLPSTPSLSPSPLSVISEPDFLRKGKHEAANYAIVYQNRNYLLVPILKN